MCCDVAFSSSCIATAQIIEVRHACISNCIISGYMLDKLQLSLTLSYQFILHSSSASEGKTNLHPKFHLDWVQHFLPLVRDPYTFLHMHDVPCWCMAFNAFKLLYYRNKMIYLIFLSYTVGASWCITFRAQTVTGAILWFPMNNVFLPRRHVSVGQSVLLSYYFQRASRRIYQYNTYIAIHKYSFGVGASSSGLGPN